MSVVRGRHQMSFGGNMSHWTVDSEDNARAAGDFNFNGQATGLPLADFMTGQTSLVRHGAPGVLLMNQLWHGPKYAQDTWRTTALTLNAGLRWEPLLRTEHRERRHFKLHPRQFPPGNQDDAVPECAGGPHLSRRPGFPDGKAGMNKQWRNCRAPA